MLDIVNEMHAHKLLHLWDEAASDGTQRRSKAKSFVEGVWPDDSIRGTAIRSTSS